MSNKFQVVNIIDKYTLIINYGAEKGAQSGQKLRIFDDGDEIKDLNGESLGRIDVVKDEVEIVLVYPKFSICKKIELVTKNIYSFVNIETKEEVEKTLNISTDSISEIKYTSSEPIKIGDYVKIIKK